jgi:hypothetical protein
MEKIEINGELLFELSSKKDWIRRFPNILTQKKRTGETLIWVDKNGNVFERGADFMHAEDLQTYPCKVYRLNSVTDWAKNK